MSKFTKIAFFLFALPICLSASTNPFSIHFPDKLNLNNEDYLEIQRQLRQIDIAPLIQQMYDNLKKPGFTTFDDFFGRCSKCIQQKLIDPKNGLFPQKELIKIGKGGDRCFVCCGPLSGKYPQYIKEFCRALQQQGFNGYFLYFIGGWPNPTGEEIQYVGVPYSFKIFSMVEAHVLGFNNVLWIDAACIPLRNPEPLFEIIAKNGALLNWLHPSPGAWRFIFPETCQLLQQLTGTDVLATQYINTVVFGLKMDSPLAQKLVQIYYECARLGTPFLSCFPEEWVLTAITGREEFQCWKNIPRLRLMQGSLTNAEDSPREFEVIRQKGTYFYHRKGR